MRILTLLAALMLNTVFGKTQQRDALLNDLTSADCQNQNSMQIAQKRLKDQNIKVPKAQRGTEGLRRLCEELRNTSATVRISEEPKGPEEKKGLTTKLGLTRRIFGWFPPWRKKKGHKESLPKTHFEKMPFSEENQKTSKTDEGLDTAIHGNFALCSSYEALKDTAERYSVPYKRAIDTCSHYQRQILLASDSPNSSLREFEFLGNQVDQILEKFYIRRNPYVTDLRMRFARSLRPGIDEEAPHPHQVLGIEEGYPWICIPNEPFSGPSLSGSSSRSERKMISFSSPMGPRIEDDDKFVYSYNNGLELVGSDRDNYTLRSIRLEYFCLERDSAHCTKENYDQKILLIEESVKTKGLISRALDWITNLHPDTQEVLYTYLAAKGGRAQSNYPLEDEKDCNGTQLLMGCEIAVRYFECAADTAHITKGLLNPSSSAQNRKKRSNSKEENPSQ